MSYALARAALFRIGGGDAEAAHEWTLHRLSRLSPRVLGLLRRRYAVEAPVRVFGVDFPNPVGLAAGMDKNGLALPAWPALGFGFVEVGTVTAYAQPGNPRPRLFRLRESQAVVNRMGFNNEGAAALASRLTELGPLPVPLGISLGKSKATPLGEAVADYHASYDLLRDHASYVAVNVSSPNTPGLRSLQDRPHLDALLEALVGGEIRPEERSDEAGSRRPSRVRASGASAANRVLVGGPPVLVKIAPDLTEAAIAELLQVCVDRGAAGVIATNTTLSRSGVAAADAALAGAEAGGLSGRPLTARAREVVEFVCRETGGALPVIGVGGILDPDDATRLLDAGASLVQLYTGFIYRGPALVRSVARAARSRPARAVGVP
ncbi:quinone-dependent dihydroorotate dehydrogenase [Phytohabitans suffuscus]|uniref:Dihydroorotate dehydrogenase (quinone) n=1 Tax=Phytohabitans suffuscus TaxID=624315 RepID=A0A6F8YTB2_9ACTN|nr:quinone-dependent dihydroorotate dehydrogenase [Phytohabitans suffuscus]BCB89071.1 dihydroorotate dehydrogenase (quinone) [Phytohabitans suffuscus]